MFGKNKKAGKGASGSTNKTRTRSTEAGTEVGNEASNARRSKTTTRSSN